MEDLIITKELLNNYYAELCKKVEERYPDGSDNDDDEWTTARVVDLLIEELNEMGGEVELSKKHYSYKRFLDVFEKTHHFDGGMMTNWVAMFMLMLYKLGNEPGKKLPTNLQYIVDGYFLSLGKMDEYVQRGGYELVE